MTAPPLRTRPTNTQRSLNVPGGLLSFVVLKGISKAGQSMGMRRGLFAPFSVQVRAPPPRRARCVAPAGAACACGGAGHARALVPLAHLARAVRPCNTRCNPTCCNLQENTVVQTYVSAAYSIAFTGGFGT